MILHEDRIIGEGWHRRFGEAHAEVNAVNSVENQDLLKDSTLYVTLEPCSHFGKTPPCADLILQKEIPRVVIANQDPYEEVSGRGIGRLRDAGVEVETGVLAASGEFVNRRFFKAIRQKRPWVILKWAETADGFIARKNYESKWISNQYSRKLVHKWRSEEDAIMSGLKPQKWTIPA